MEALVVASVVVILVENNHIRCCSLATSVADFMHANDDDGNDGNDDDDGNDDMIMIMMMMIPSAPTLFSPTSLTALLNQRSKIFLNSVADTLSLVTSSLSGSKAVVPVLVLISVNNEY